MTSSGTAKRRRLSGRAIGGIALVVVAIVFMVQNTGRVRMTFLFFTVSTPVWLMMLVMLVIGWLAGGAIWNGLRRLTTGEKAPGNS